MNHNLTVGTLSRRFGVPGWRLRIVIDELGVEIPRAGGYRLIPESLLPAVEAALQRRGWLPEHSEATR